MAIKKDSQLGAVLRKIDNIYVWVVTLWQKGIISHWVLTTNSTSASERPYAMKYGRRKKGVVEMTLYCDICGKRKGGFGEFGGNDYVEEHFECEKIKTLRRIAEALEVIADNTRKGG